MKEEKIYKMSATDEKILSLMCNIGFSHSEGKILVYMLNMKQAKSREIERAMEMSQPEVSISIRNMIDIFQIDKSYKETRGRPIYTYKLKKPLIKIVEEKAQKRIKIIEENLKELKKLMKE